MNEETLKALKGSIKKWEDIVNGKGEDLGVNNCPLCQLFCYKELSCASCPIYQETECDDCQNTPYEDWKEHLIKVHNTKMGSIECPKCKELAKAELEFLKTFLPTK